MNPQQSQDLKHPENTRRIAVAHLLRPQGRRGELLAEPLTDLAGVFVPGRRLWKAEVGVSASETPSCELEACWTPTGRNAGRIVLKLVGLDSIAAAEAVAGHTLFLAETDLPPRDPDTFLVEDLLGCTLYDGNRSVGQIVDVQFAMAPDGRTRLADAAPLLLLQLGTAPEQEPTLVPFVKAWLQTVDVARKCICMTLPAGLLPEAGLLHEAELLPPPGVPPDDA